MPPHEPSDPTKRGASAPAPDVDLVEYLVVGVPDLGSLEAVATAVADLVASSLLSILDLVCVSRSALGELSVLELEDVEALAGLLGVPGHVGGLLSDHDVSTAALAIAPGSSALVLLAESRWAASLSTAARAGGGRILGGERVASARVEEAIGSGTVHASPAVPAHRAGS